MNIALGMDMAARIVALADDIRQNYKAKGVEAERQFEESVMRNRESFAEMIADLGGYPAPTPPPTGPPVVTPPVVTPPVTPPVVTTPPVPATFAGYDKWQTTDPGDGPLKNNDNVYSPPSSAWNHGEYGHFLVHEGGPAPANFGLPQSFLLRVVQK